MSRLLSRCVATAREFIPWATAPTRSTRDGSALRALHRPEPTTATPRGPRPRRRPNVGRLRHPCVKNGPPSLQRITCIASARRILIAFLSVASRPGLHRRGVGATHGRQGGRRRGEHRHRRHLVGRGGQDPSAGRRLIYREEEEDEDEVEDEDDDDDDDEDEE